jgi:Fe-Mn family superoxide dismutase
MAFELPPLPYPYDALEDYIDTETMHLHHDKHHATYVNNLNAVLQNEPPFNDLPVDDVVRRMSEVPENIRTAVRNNAGGHSNHTMFWQIMTPNGGGAPDGDLARAIERDFGSFEAFKTAFNNAGAKVFGSGWVWLIINPAGKLEITTTANQDSPLLNGILPIMGNDVWEHAYYLKYQNRRPEYLSAWWNVLNWNEIQRRYSVAQQ